MTSKLQKKQLHMAAQEHELAVLAFANTMRDADLVFITQAFPGVFRITLNMVGAWKRYIAACKRLYEAQ